MTKKLINIGSEPNDGTGDSLRDGMNKINQNFNEIYSTFGNGSSLNGLGVGDAETLNGQDSSYYLDYNNFTNTPEDLSVFNNSVGFVTSSIVDGLASTSFVIGIATTKADLSGSNFSGIVTATKFDGSELEIVGIATVSEDLNVGIDTSSGLVLTSPNGTQYRLIVDDLGALSTVVI